MHGTLTEAATCKEKLLKIFIRLSKISIACWARVILLSKTPLPVLQLYVSNSLHTRRTLKIQ
jgi:hypothetical protein